MFSRFYGAHLLWVFVGVLCLSSFADAQNIGKWRRYVVEIPNPSFEVNPFLIQMTATFTHEASGTEVKLHGYYDGNGIWKVGFMPTLLGTWSYSTTSPDPELNGVNGSLTCVQSNHPGPLRADTQNPKKWKYQDGPYALPMAFRMEIFFEPGSTERFTQLADFLANDVKGTMFETRLLDEYGSLDGRNDYIFAGDWRSGRFDLENWRRFEQRLEILTERGLGAHIMFYADDAGKPQWRGYSATEKAVIRYVVARVAGFPNIWFNTGIDIAEYRDGAWIDWFGAEISALDPYDHPISSRHGGGSGEYVMSGQSFDSEAVPYQARIQEIIANYLDDSLPVSMDDAWGENRSSHEYKNHTAEDIRRGFWKCLVAGGVGALVRGSDGLYHIENFEEDLESEQWLRFVNPFLDEQLGSHFATMAPTADLVSNAYCLSNVSRSKMLFLFLGKNDRYDRSAGTEFVVKLRELSDETFQARWFDPRQGRFVNHADLAGGENHEISVPSNDDWLLLVEQMGASNEPPRVAIQIPTVESEVRVDAGTALTFEVQAADVDGEIVSYRWNFGDFEETGTGAPPSNHVYTWDTAGSFLVTLTVTDDGNPAQTVTSEGVMVRVDAPLSVKVVSTPSASDTNEVRFSAEILGGASQSSGFLETGGALLIEAEHFTDSAPNADPNGDRWRVASREAGFRGLGYLQTDSAKGTNGSWEAACEVSYDLQVNSAGVYTFWLRRSADGTSNDSCLVGLDDTPFGQAADNRGESDWGWVSVGSASVTAGSHTLQLRRRESGYRVDALYMTRNGDTPNDSIVEGERGAGFSYHWQFGDGNSSTEANPTHRFNRPGSFTVTLVVSGGGESTQVTQAVTVEGTPNKEPQVNAGGDARVNVPGVVRLKGLVSDDNTAVTDLDVTWQVIAGNGTVIFQNSKALETWVGFFTPGEFLLQLTAHDGELEGADIITIIVDAEPVNLPPTVEAGEDQSIVLGEVAQLSGMSADDALLVSMPSLLWTQVTGPGEANFADPTAHATTVGFTAAGVYLLQLTADDGEHVRSDQVTVTVLTINAPLQLEVTTTALSGAAPLDVGFMTEVSGGASNAGVIYFWSFGDGSNSTLSNPSHLFDEPGSYFVDVSATDATGTVSRRIEVEVMAPANAAPVVDAGADRTAPVHTDVTLIGSVTDDDLPSPPSYVATQWRVVAGPGAVEFSDDMSMTTTARFMSLGSYILELVADDGELSDSDRIQVTVEANGTDEFELDEDTVALFHFDRDFADESTGHFDMLASGNARVVQENRTWMQEPSGGVARFEALGDTLQVTLPDALVLPENGSTLSLELRIFVRRYLAWGVANREIIGLRQFWDTSFSIHDRRWAHPRNPNVISCNQEVVTSTVWEDKLPLNAWHALKLTFDGKLVQVWVNNELIGDREVVPNFERNQDWTVLIGNFDGDIDELRVSRTVR